MEKYRQGTAVKQDDVIRFVKTGLTKHRKALFHYLIQKIILYNDKMEILYNYIDKKSPDCTATETFYCGTGSTGSLLCLVDKNTVPSFYPF